jgi:hypothetical protein
MIGQTHLEKGEETQLPARALELSVVNDLGGIDLVDTVAVVLPVMDGFKQEISTTKIPGDGKIIITHYSREEHILSGQAASTMFKFRIMPANSNITKVSGFGKYLRDRKKAAVFRMKDSSDCYILPPAPDRNILTHGLSCLSSICLADVLPAAATASSTNNTSNSSSSDINSKGKQSAESASASTPKSFLSNLLSKVKLVYLSTFRKS